MTDLRYDTQILKYSMTANRKFQEKIEAEDGYTCKNTLCKATKWGREEPFGL